jgi:long-chain acyl-CoA synthetase
LQHKAFGCLLSGDAGQESIKTQNMEDLKSPLAMLYHWEQHTPDKVFMVQPVEGQWRRITWREAAAEIRRLAAALRSYGLPPGSRIGLVSKNCAHWIMADFAIMMAGHISIPVYPNAGAETLNYVLTHSESKILFVGKLDEWDFMKTGVPDDVLCISFPWYGPRQDGFQYWEDLTRDREPLAENPDRDLSDVMSIIYTSGTTGHPKGVVHTFHNFAWAVMTGKNYFGVKDSESKLFSYLPLSHIAERMITELVAVYANSEVWFAESLSTFAHNLADARPTIFFGVPRIWTKFQLGVLAKVPQKKLDLLLSIPLLRNFISAKIRKGLGLNDCTHYLCAAAPVSTSLLDWWARLGVKVEEVYAMTENCAISHGNRKDGFKRGTQGKPLPGVEAKLSEEGEILVKAPCNMLGYYHEPELTAATLKDGWLYTGDKGVIDADGFVKITGRVKEIFKTDKGKYISPSPIEMKLGRNNYIEQVCVMGSGLPQPIALIVLSADGRNRDRDHLRQGLLETLEQVNPELEKHERLHNLVVLKDDWTIENGLLTPTLKIKRNPIESKYQARYSQWYGMSDAVVFEE